MQIICIMGRSGSGKSALESTLESLGYERIISCTTRPPRGNERDGVEYHFVSREKFAELIENGSLLEHAEYNGNLYGSPRPAALKNVVVLEPQGYAHLKKMYPQTLGVFIYLPEDVIVQRLSGCTGTTYLRNAGKGGTGGGKCGKGPILGGFAAGWPRNRGGMSQLF